ncbi:MAG: tetratricopeptide repeat protein, partial [Bacteroidales bacterium]|nr:tetratricopeptide repeat protein [Bacteroidales bacterium]
MMKIFILIYNLFLFSTISFSQITVIDSLIKASENEKSDSALIQNYIKTSRLFHNLNKKDTALYYIKKAENISVELSKSKQIQIKETGSFLLADCYYSKGNIYYADMDFINAEENYNKGLQICNHLIKYSDNKSIIGETQKLKTDIYTGIANIYTDKGYYSVALNNYIEAQRITDTLIKQRIISEKESAAQFFHLVLIHYYLNNYVKSLDYYRKSLKISEKYNNKFAIAKTNSNIGISETKLNRIDSALTYFSKALKYAEAEKNEIFKAQIYDNMADCYIKQKKYDKAELYLAKAMIITEKNNSKFGKIYITLGLADLYTKTGRYDKALSYATNALSISKEIQSISMIKNSYLRLSKIYENKNDYKNSLKYYKKYKSLEDSIFNKEKNRQIQESEAKYQANKKQEEINRQKLELAKRDAEIKIKKTQNYIFTAVLISLLIILLIILFTLKQKQKINKLIKKQNQRITDSISYAEKIQ